MSESSATPAPSTETSSTQPAPAGSSATPVAPAPEVFFPIPGFRQVPNFLLDGSDLVEHPLECQLLLYFLSKAAISPKLVSFNGCTVHLQAGEFLTSLSFLARTLNSTVRKIRTGTSYLKAIGAIRVEQTTRSYTKISVAKPVTYNDAKSQNERPTHKRHTSDTPATHPRHTGDTPKSAEIPDTCAQNQPAPDTGSRHTDDTPHVRARSIRGGDINININKINKKEEKGESPQSSLDFVPSSSAPTEKPQLQQAQNFIVPTLEEVKTFCLEKNSTVDGEHFWHYYDERGWKLSGGGVITNWKKIVRSWERADAREAAEAAATSQKREAEAVVTPSKEAAPVETPAEKKPCKKNNSLSEEEEAAWLASCRQDHSEGYSEFEDGGSEEAEGARATEEAEAIEDVESVETSEANEENPCETGGSSENPDVREDKSADENLPNASASPVSPESQDAPAEKTSFPEEKETASEANTSPKRSMAEEMAADPGEYVAKHLDLFAIKDDYTTFLEKDRKAEEERKKAKEKAKKEQQEKWKKEAEQLATRFYASRPTKPEELSPEAIQSRFLATRQQKEPQESPEEQTESRTCSCSCGCPEETKEPAAQQESDFSQESPEEQVEPHACSCSCSCVCSCGCPEETKEPAAQQEEAPFQAQEQVLEEERLLPRVAGYRGFVGSKTSCPACGGLGMAILGTKEGVTLGRIYPCLCCNSDALTQAEEDFLKKHGAKIVGQV